MKTILLGLLTLSFITQSDFEYLLYKHINEVVDAELLYDESLPYSKVYTVKGEFRFMGEFYQTLYLSTDKNDTIQNFSFAMNRIVDRSFYDEMVKEYGSPVVMYKSGEIISEDTGHIGGTETNPGILSKSTLAIRKECSFEEKPTSIIWDKKDYKIKVFIKYGTNLFNPTIIYIGNADFVLDKLRNEIQE